MLPFVFYPLQELLEALVAAEVCEEGIVFHKNLIKYLVETPDAQLKAN
jgi:hypothetical protein